MSLDSWQSVSDFLEPPQTKSGKILLRTNNTYHLRLVGDPYIFYKVWYGNGDSTIVSEKAAKSTFSKAKLRAAWNVIDRSTGELSLIEMPRKVIEDIKFLSDNIYITRRQKYGHQKARLFHPGARYGAKVTIRVTGQGLTTRYEVALSGKFFSKADTALLKESKLPDLKEMFSAKV